MLRVGATDVFEREYTQKFRALAGQFGEFVMYERDRGARDIGLHLTRKLRSGGEQMSSALCWFQLKGITAASLTEESFRQNATVKIPLKVQHLQFWYLQPMPTYLVVYIQSVDTFLVLNIQQHIDARWGRSIMTLAAKETTVEVPRDSTLDEQAFYLILRESDVREWSKAIGQESRALRMCHRDFELIWHIGTALKREVKHRATIIDWQSKLRGEIHFEESPLIGEEDWRPLRNHWQSMLRATGAQGAYPYLEFYALDDDEDSWIWDDDEDSYVPDLTLANGDVIHGKDYAGEYFEYIVGVKLNRMGKRLMRSVENLLKIGLIEINEQMGEFISIAPWEGRSV